MTIFKIPVQGTMFQNGPVIPGVSGTNALTGAVTNPPTNEISINRFLLSGAAIVLDGATATVTLASHLNTFIGQQVTFSGATGVTAINDQTWTINAITSTSVYTFPCILTGTVTGTIVQEPVFTLPPGVHFLKCNSNAIVEYQPDNTYVSVNGSLTAPTWKKVISHSGDGVVPSDGWAVRLRCEGTTASTKWSIVN